ncbi:MAG: M20 family metallopeptidase, partial [Clostridiaceae bacterium]
MNIEELYETVKEIRRDLHQIPEISFDLPKTSQYVKEKLEAFGYEPQSVAHTGWIAVIKGKSEEAVAFRSDMDALMVTEETGAEFASLHQGKMHACGHDGHMAMLLGFAKYLKSLDVLEKTVVLIFQPAEESPGGARIIMETGVLQALNVQKIYGFHLYPGLPEGIIGLAKGPMMARSGEFDIKVEGQSSHGGQPHLGIDAILAATQIISGAQTIISRNMDPLEPVVVNIGTIQAGEARNIVAGTAEMTGTIRSYNDEVYFSIKEKLKGICDGVMYMTGAKVSLEIRDFYPPVVNDEGLVEALKKKFPEERYEILKPLMTAEDFSYYQQEFRGVFMMLGTKREDRGWTYPLH